ncbi:hypothetical protein ACFWHQ_37865 [Streptomyces sp. NPDC060334]|uniref:hypothetical protein n=1 Tax=unclassified Streptomyces TaxID=2593676 RepID=UPI0036517887
MAVRLFSGLGSMTRAARMRSSLTTGESPLYNHNPDLKELRGSRVPHQLDGVTH